MANDLFRFPDKRSGPALMNREPVVLPDARKKATRKVKDTLNQ